MSMCKHAHVSSGRYLSFKMSWTAFTEFSSKESSRYREMSGLEDFTRLMIPRFYQTEWIKNQAIILKLHIIHTAVGLCSGKTQTFLLNKLRKDGGMQSCFQNTVI